MQTLITLLIVARPPPATACGSSRPAALRHKLAAQSGTLARATGASAETARRIEIKAHGRRRERGRLRQLRPVQGLRDRPGQGRRGRRSA